LGTRGFNIPVPKNEKNPFESFLTKSAGFVPNFAGWHGIAPIERYGGKVRPDVRAGTKGPLGENLTFNSPIVKKLIKQNIDKGIPLPRAIQAAAQQIKTSKQGFLSIREQKRILEGIKSGNLNLAGGFIPNFARGQGTRHGTVGIKEFSAMNKQAKLDWINSAESESYLRKVTGAKGFKKLPEDIQLAARNKEKAIKSGANIVKGQMHVGFDSTTGLGSGRRGHRAVMLVPAEAKVNPKDGQTEMDLSPRGPINNIKVSWPIGQLKYPVAEKGKEKDFIKNIEDEVQEYSTNIAEKIREKTGIKGLAEITPELYKQEFGEAKGIQGAVNAAAGGAFEVASRMAFGFKSDEGADTSRGDFDVREDNMNLLKKGKGRFSNLKESKVGELKINSGSPDIKQSMRNKILKRMFGISDVKGLERMVGVKKSAALGFNSKEVQRAIAAETMAGADPEYRTSPFPHVADKKTQKTFSDVLKDHPDLGKAIKSSKKQQSFVPNFAPVVDKGGAFDPNARAGLSTAIKDLPIQLRDWGQRISVGIMPSIEKLQKEQKQLESEISRAEKAYGKNSLQVKELNTKEQKVSKQLDRRIRVDNIQAKRSEKMAGFMQKYEGAQTKMLTASFVLPQAAGILSETIFKGSPKMQKSIDAVSGSMSTGAAAMGVIPGPAGMVVGGLIAAGGSIRGLIKAQTDLGEQYKHRAEKAKEEETKFSDASSKYLSALEAASRAYEKDSEGRRKSPEQIQKIYEELEKTLKEIPSAYRTEMASMSNLNDAREAAAKAMDILAEKARQEGQAESMRQKINEMKGAGGNVAATKIFAGGEDFAEQMMKLGGSKLREAFAKDSNVITGGDYNPKTFKNADLINKLGEMGALSKSQVEVMSRIKNINELEGENGKKAIEALQELLLGRKVDDKQAVVISKMLQESGKQTAILNEQIEESTTQSNLLREQILALNAFGRSFSTKVREDEKQLTLARAKGAVDLGSDYLTPEAKSDYKFLLDSAEINLNASKKANEDSAAIFDKLTKDMTTRLEKARVQSVGRAGLPTDKYESSDIIKGATDSVMDYVRSIKGDIGSGNIQELNTGLLNVIDGLSGLEESLQKELRTSISHAQNQTTMALADNERLRRQSMQLAILNKQIESQKSLFNELKSAFGGIGSFIKGGDDAPWNQNEAMKKNLEMLQPYLGNSSLDKVGAERDYARGMLGVAQEIMKNFPNATGQTPEAVRQMKQAITPILADVYEKQLTSQKDMINQYAGNTPIAGLTKVLDNANPMAMAMAQVDSFLKGDQLPKHLQDMVNKLETLNQSLNLKTMTSAFRDGMDTSLMMEKISKSYDDIKTLLTRQEQNLIDFDEGYQKIAGEAQDKMGKGIAGGNYDKFAKQQVEEIRKLNQSQGALKQNSDQSLYQQKVTAKDVDNFIKEALTGHSLPTKDYVTHESLDKLNRTQTNTLIKLKQAEDNKRKSAMFGTMDQPDQWLPIEYTRKAGDIEDRDFKHGAHSRLTKGENLDSLSPLIGGIAGMPRSSLENKIDWKKIGSKISEPIKQALKEFRAGWKTGKGSTFRPGMGGYGWSEPPTEITTRSRRVGAGLKGSAESAGEFIKENLDKAKASWDKKSEARLKLEKGLEKGLGDFKRGYRTGPQTYRAHGLPPVQGGIIQRTGARVREGADLLRRANTGIRESRIGRGLKKGLGQFGEGLRTGKGTVRTLSMGGYGKAMEVPGPMMQQAGAGIRGAQNWGKRIFEPAIDAFKPFRTMGNLGLEKLGEVIKGSKNFLKTNFRSVGGAPKGMTPWGAGRARAATLDPLAKSYPTEPVRGPSRGGAPYKVSRQKVGFFEQKTPSGNSLGDIRRLVEIRAQEKSMWEKFEREFPERKRGGKSEKIIDFVDERIPRGDAGKPKKPTSAKTMEYYATKKPAPEPAPEPASKKVSERVNIVREVMADVGEVVSESMPTTTKAVRKINEVYEAGKAKGAKVAGGVAAAGYQGIKTHGGSALNAGRATLDAARAGMGIETWDGKRTMGEAGVPKWMEGTLVNKAEMQGKNTGLASRAKMTGLKTTTGLAHLGGMLGLHYVGRQAGGLLSGGESKRKEARAEGEKGRAEYGLTDHALAAIGLKEESVVGGNKYVQEAGGALAVASLFGKSTALGLEAAIGTHKLGALAEEKTGLEGGGRLGMYTSLPAFGAAQNTTATLFKNMKGLKVSEGLAGTKGLTSGLGKGNLAAMRGAAKYAPVLTAFEAGYGLYSGHQQTKMEEGYTGDLRSAADKIETDKSEIYQKIRERKSAGASKEEVASLRAQANYQAKILNYARQREQMSAFYGKKGFGDRQQTELMNYQGERNAVGMSARQMTGFQNAFMGVFDLPANMQSWQMKWGKNMAMKAGDMVGLEGMDKEARKNMREKWETEKIIPRFSQEIGTTSVLDFYDEYRQDTLKAFKAAWPKIANEMIKTVENKSEDRDGKVTTTKTLALNQALTKTQLNKFQEFIDKEGEDESIYKKRATTSLRRIGGLDSSAVMKGDDVQDIVKTALQQEIEIREERIKAEKTIGYAHRRKSRREALEKSILNKNIAKDTTRYRRATPEEINKVFEGILTKAKNLGLTTDQQGLEKMKKRGWWTQESIGMTREEYGRRMGTRAGAGGKRVIPHTMGSGYMTTSSKDMENLKDINEARILLNKLAMAKDAEGKPVIYNTPMGEEREKLNQGKLKDSKAVRSYLTDYGEKPMPTEYEKLFDNWDKQIGGKAGETPAQIWDREWGRSKDTFGGQLQPTKGQTLSKLKKISDEALPEEKRKQMEEERKRLGKNVRVAGKFDPSFFMTEQGREHRGLQAEQTKDADQVKLNELKARMSEKRLDKDIKILESYNGKMKKLKEEELKINKKYITNKDLNFHYFEKDAPDRDKKLEKLNITMEESKNKELEVVRKQISDLRSQKIGAERSLGTRDAMAINMMGGDTVRAYRSAAIREKLEASNLDPKTRMEERGQKMKTLRDQTDLSTVTRLAFTMGIKETGKTIIGPDDKFEKGYKREEKIVDIQPGQIIESPIKPGTFFTKTEDGRILTAMGTKDEEGKFTAPKRYEEEFKKQETQPLNRPDLTKDPVTGQWSKWQPFKHENEISNWQKSGLGRNNMPMLTQEDYDKWMNTTSNEQVAAAFGEGGDRFMGDVAYRTTDRDANTDTKISAKGGFMSDEVKPGYALVTPKGIIYNKQDVKGYLDQLGGEEQAEQMGAFKKWDPKAESLVGRQKTEKEKEAEKREKMQSMKIDAMPDLNKNLTNLSVDVQNLQSEIILLNNNMIEFQGMKGVIATVQKVAGMANRNESKINRLSNAAEKGVKPSELPQGTARERLLRMREKAEG
jgi:hypothetical protein